MGDGAGHDYSLELTSLPCPFSAGISSEIPNYEHLVEEQFTPQVVLEVEDDLVAPPPGSC